MIPRAVVSYTHGVVVSLGQHPDTDIVSILGFRLGTVETKIIPKHLLNPTPKPRTSRFRHPSPMQQQPSYTAELDQFIWPNRLSDSSLPSPSLTLVERMTRGSRLMVLRTIPCASVDASYRIAK